VACTDRTREPLKLAVLVLVHMGTPNSRYLYGRNVRDAAERGMRLIGYNRPGYGESSP